jgi:uncharacterized phage protein (TIGR02220 family)
VARIRTVKPEFWTDSKTGTLSGDATKLFIGILNFSDDYGIIEYKLEELKAKIFPYSSGSPTDIVGKCLVDELLPKGLVILIKWEDKPYLWVRNFHKHQKVDRPSKPFIEGFTLQGLVGELKKEYPDTYRELTEGSLNSNGLLDEGSLCKGREGKGEEGNGGQSPSASFSDDCKKAIIYLNKKAATHFEPDNKQWLGLVNARLREGLTLGDFTLVIDEKVRQWGSDERMKNYLRPRTLFTANHMEEYLNEAHRYNKRRE